MGFIENLNWRYATKEFDGRKIPADILDKILSAIQLCPSSFGIQPYHITVVENDELKKRLNLEAFWEQKQIVTCSHVLIFSVDLDVRNRAKEYVALAAELGRTDVSDDPEFDYENEAVKFGEKRGSDWAVNQVYIALGFALAACAELKIDSCPMEAANFTEIKKILNLPDNFLPTVLLPLGYRGSNDKHSQDKKIRFGKENLFDFKK